MVELTDFTSKFKVFRGEDYEISGAKIDGNTYVALSKTPIPTWQWFLFRRAPESETEAVNLFYMKPIDPTGFVFNDEVYRVKFDYPDCMKQTGDYYVYQEEK